MSTTHLYFDLSSDESQHSFTNEMLDNIISYVYENRHTGSISSFDNEPVFDEMMIISIGYRMVPNTLEIYFMRDESGCWWPFRYHNVLPDANVYTHFGFSVLSGRG
ncbi:MULTISPECIES: hypothetical protein [Photorhabdus]|uniref:Uncharacterized protein n=2 Tax=Photorhabdus TaxID=29487 RepID=A0AAW6BMU7_9GAMM|nr:MULTISPECIES: hypothetical protein [Photorhabdus]EYU13382.1 hypothetical protein BA1DRAFT_04130 [Photorhabdus aegyptia]MDB6375074.1 hypothetical protein [Photorhabdus bodei]